MSGASYEARNSLVRGQRRQPGRLVRRRTGDGIAWWGASLGSWPDKTVLAGVRTVAKSGKESYNEGYLIMLLHPVRPDAGSL